MQRPTADVTGIVLAGGRSTRMGREKSTLILGGRTLLQRAVDALVAARVSEIVVVGAPGRTLPTIDAPVPVRRTDDAVEGEGPLQGILAGLEVARSPVSVVVGCDMPFLAPGLLALLARRATQGANLVVPLHDGRPQGLCSAWRRDAIEVIRAHLAAGDRAVMSVEHDLEALLLPPDAYAEHDSEGRSFVNLNTSEELDRASLETDRARDEG